MLRIRSAALTAGVVLGGVLALGEPAFSQQMARPRAPRQYRGVTNEPYVSPYLNIVRPGADPAFNYYTLVQPQLQQQQFNLQQNRNVQNLGRQLQQQEAEIMTPYGAIGRRRSTGRAATYMNYSHYYPALGAGPSGGRRYTSSAGAGGMGMGMSMGGMGGGY
jgi:hypothetical protein